MTDARLACTLAPPPVRFRPSAPQPLERDAGLFSMLFNPRMSRNPLTAIPREAFELPYRRAKVLQFTYHGLNDPDAIKRVFLDNAANYRRPQFVKRLLRPILGEGLLNAEGDPWRSQRRMMAGAFAPHAVVAAAPLFARLAERSCDRTPGDGGTVDMAAEATRTTLEVIDEALYSGQTGMPFDETSGLVRDVLAGTGELRLAMLLGLEALDLAPAQLRARRARRILLERMGQFIRRRAAAADPPDDFVTRLYAGFAAEHPREEAIQLTLDNAMTFFVAGHETTANGLAWALYLLAGDPQAQAWAREEAVAAWAAGDPARVVERLPYLKMVWEETLRLYPPVHRIDREALGEDELCGRKIRKGDMITVWPWVLHRHRRLWDEPELFNPENFDPEAKAGRRRYQYIPFGAGPRICIGMGFAQAEALTILSRWLATFRFASVAGRTVEPRADFTLRPDGGLPLLVERL
jgi:cytochrome P450